MSRGASLARPVTVALALAALVSGCAANVAVVLDFPTSRAFDVSELVRIDVVRVASDELGSCPAVIDATLRAEPLDLALALDDTNVCEVERGLALGDPGGGALAFVAQVIDDRNTVILVGCTIAEAYPGGPAVRIELYPTGDYTASAGRLAETATRAGGTCGGGP